MKRLNHLLSFTDHIKEASTPNKPAATPAEAAQFAKELESWNKTYAQAFKFVNDSGNTIEQAYVPKVQEAVNKLIALLKKQPDLKFEIVAHTSSPKAGKAWGGSNEKLSQARAEFIKSQLVRIGKVNPENFTTTGKGFAEPLVKDDTVGTPEQIAQKQLQNRRVEVKVSGQLEITIPVEELKITKTQFLPDSIVPNSVPNALALRSKYRLYTAKRKSNVPNAESQLLFVSNADDTKAKVEGMDISEITPPATSELVQKLTKIGQYYEKNLMGKDVTISITGFSIDNQPDFAQCLATARSSFMKKLLLQVAPKIKPEQITTVAKAVRGSAENIKAQIDFVSSNGTKLNR